MATLEVALLLLVLILTVCSASASTGCIAGIGGTCQLREETCNEEHDNEWVSPSSAPFACSMAASVALPLTRTLRVLFSFHALSRLQSECVRNVCGGKLYRPLLSGAWLLVLL